VFEPDLKLYGYLKHMGVGLSFWEVLKPQAHDSLKLVNQFGWKELSHIFV
jgi:hypothetical protein